MSKYRLDNTALTDAIGHLRTAAALSVAAGVTKAAISMAKKRGYMSVPLAIAIEAATRGKVARERLIPDAFRRRKTARKGGCA